MKYLIFYPGMVNERIKQPRLAIAVIAVAVVMLVAASAEMAITGYVFAYNRNQATGAANDCGNGQIPTNIGCQNTDSQIQGDENSVAITAQQTFPEVQITPPTPPPPAATCEGSFNFITLEKLDPFRTKLAEISRIVFPGGDPPLKAFCPF